MGFIDCGRSGELLIMRMGQSWLVLGMMLLFTCMGYENRFGYSLFDFCFILFFTLFTGDSQ
jgi:hypothetical protein